MSWTVEYLDVAKRQFLALPKRIQGQVAKKIGHLEDDPFPVGSEKLTTPEDLYRIRSGDYRVVYRVDRAERLVEIIRVRHRKDVYRDY